MFSRRKFIQTTAISASLLAVNKKSIASLTPSALKTSIKPIVISTWDFGVAANAAAWKVLSAG